MPLLILIAAATGCKTAPTPVSATKSPATQLTPLAQYCAVVPPKTIEPSLTDEQITKMFLPLDQIPLTEVTLPTDPNSTAPATQPLSDPNIQNESEKIYLRAKVLNTDSRFPAAANLLTKQIKRDPQNPKLLQLLAQTEFEAGRSEAASLAAVQTLQADPDNLTAWHILGTIYQNRSQHLEAAWLFEKALDLPNAEPANPTTAILRLQFAAALLQLDYLAAAAEQYRIAAELLMQQAGFAQTNPLMKKLIPQLHLPLITLASLDVQIGYMDRAAEDLNNASEFLNPDVDLMQAFVNSLATQKAALHIRYQRVTAFCRYLIAARQNPRHTVLLLHQACAKMGKQTDFIPLMQQWGQTTVAGEQLVPAPLLAYALTVDQQYDQALATLRNSKIKTFDDQDIRLDMAMISAKTKHWDEMVDHLADLLNEQPDKLDNITKLLTNISENRDSLIAFVQNIDLTRPDRSSDAPWHCFIIAVLAESVINYDTAESLYKTALSLKPDFEPAFENLMDLLVRLDKYDLAIETFQKYSKKVPDNIIAIACAAKAHTGLKNYTQAQHLYQQIIALAPDNLAAFLNLAEILYRQHKFAAAEELLLRSLDRWPDQPEIYHHLFACYARWNAQPDLPEPVTGAALAQSRKMFARWINRLKDDLASQDINPQDANLAPPENSNPADNNTPAKKSDPWVGVNDALKSLADEFPNGVAIHLVWAEFLAARNKLDQALNVIDTGLAAAPDNQPLAQLAAELYHRNNDYDREAQIRAKLVELNPDNPDLVNDSIRAMRLAGKSDQALNLLIKFADRPAMQNLSAVGRLLTESLKLFQITRQYPQAVDLYQRWADLADATPKINVPQKPDTIKQSDTPQKQNSTQNQNSANDPTPTQTSDIKQPFDDAQKKIILAIQKNLLWAMTQAQQFDRAALFAQTMFQQQQNLALPEILDLVRALNIRLMYAPSLALSENLILADPNQPALRLLHCKTLIDQDTPDLAAQYALDWLNQKPDDKIRQNLYIVTLNTASLYDRLEQYLRDSIQKSPDPLLRINLVEILTVTGKYKQAQDELALIPTDKKVAVSLLETQVKLDIAQDQYQLALVRLNKFVPDAEESPLIDRWTVDILAASGQTDKAIELNQKLIAKKSDNNAPARLQQTLFFERAGKVDLAVEGLEKLLAEFPDNPVVKNNLGYTLLEHNPDPTRAGLLLQQAYNADPTAASTIDSLGWFYYKKGDFEKALQYIYQAAAMMDDIDYEVWDHLGDLMCRLGNTDKAVAYWKKSLADLTKRLPFEKFLNNDKSNIENKLQQIKQGKKPDLAPLATPIN